MNASGYQTTHTPTEHSALSFRPGQAGADPTYDAETAKQFTYVIGH